MLRACILLDGLGKSRQLTFDYASLGVELHVTDTATRLCFGEVQCDLGQQAQWGHLSTNATRLDTVKPRREGMVLETGIYGYCNMR